MNIPLQKLFLYDSFSYFFEDVKNPAIHLDSRIFICVFGLQ
jgi:hypothetical protein